MLDDYEQYEIECERIRESNGKLLADFEDWLRESNLADQTISKHVENIDFYINFTFRKHGIVNRPDKNSGV